MKNCFLGRVAGLAVLGIFLLLSSGCGFKNAPIPPQSVVPTPINDLLYQTSEKGVRLSWSYPVKTINGSPLDNIASFELYQAEVPLEDYCGTCPIPFGEPLQIDGGSPIDGKVRKKADYELSLLRPGYKYFVKVRSRTSWWADSADSNIVSFVWYQPAAAPQEVTAIPGDGQISLSWQPVTKLTDGSPVTKAMQYQVLRSTSEKNFEPLGKPVATTTYVDHRVQNGLRYFYTVQSMMVFKDTLINGGISKDVSATPIDLVPPAAPLAVTVVRTGVGIKVFWERSDAADIGGYRIYRRAADKDNYVLLAEVGKDCTLFVDTKTKENVRYYYAITAIDRATPPNESNKSKEATLRH